MKTTLDLDDALYRQLKAHAAMSGKSLKAMITDAIQRLLTNPENAPITASVVREAPPAWVGSLSGYAGNAMDKHDLASMRASVAKGRAHS